MTTPATAATALARPPRTVRRQLLTGVTAAVLTVVVATGLAARASGRVQRSLAVTLTEAAGQSTRLAQSSDAAVRFVAIAEAMLLTPAGDRDDALATDAARADGLAATADSLRRTLLAGRTLSTTDRRRVERVGALQGQIEVRLAVARAFRDVGRPSDAAAEAAAATAALDELLGEENAVATSQAAGAVAARQAADAAVAAQQRMVVAVLAVALLAGAALSWAAVARLTAPLTLLVRHAGALSRGDFALRTDVGPLPGEFAALGVSMNHASAALDALQAQLTHQAAHDPLTGLANRARFRQRALRALAAARIVGAPERVAVLAVDLDGFKGINDTLGHAAGDQLLGEVAERLLNATRGCDTVARLGGDEFAVLVENVRGEADVQAVAARVVDALRAPGLLDGRAAGVGASVGVARADAALPDDPDAALRALVRHADVALYAAKARGKGCHVVYDAALHADADARAELAAELRAAIGEVTAAADSAAAGAPTSATTGAPGLYLAYQPIVALDSGVLVGVEALARWEHPRRGPVPPGEFIPAAEASGLIVPLGRWALGEACRAAAAWADPAHPGGGPTLSVNVSGVQLDRPSFVDDVRATLGASGLAPQRLVLEITESAVVRDPDATRARLLALRTLGVRVAIDDFGTGYSALGYLQHFPVDVLKIDKSFVTHVAESGRGAALARTIVALGASLDLRTVAEGVETDAQRAALQAMGCALGQGFHFAHPVPAAAIAAMLAERQAAPEPSAADAPAADARRAA